VVKLSVLISTLNKGIFNLNSVLLPARFDVEYIICHQITDAIYDRVPDFLVRNDVKLYKLFNKGVTKSRNLALSKATGEIGLFSV
jgi:hypothetical protein